MRRLYVQIYVAFVGIVLLFGVLVSVAWVLLPTSPQDRRLLASMGVQLGTLLPGPERPVAELRTAVERLGRLLPAHFTVRQADGVLLAAVGDPLPSPPHSLDGHTAVGCTCEAGGRRYRWSSLMVGG
jgi:hypothetical protein